MYRLAKLDRSESRVMSMLKVRSEQLKRFVNHQHSNMRWIAQLVSEQLADRIRLHTKPRWRRMGGTRTIVRLLAGRPR